MFPTAFRHRLEDDRKYRDGVFVDELDRSRFERAWRMTGRPGGAHVADVGAFPGTGLLYFCYDEATRGFSRNRYTAIGNADGAFREKIAAAGHAVHEVDLEGGADLGVSSADVVLCMEVMEHVRRPHAFLRRLCSQLKSGARLYLTTNNAFYSGYIIKLLLHRPILDDLASEDSFYPGHCRYFALGELATALAGLGLRVESAREFTFTPPVSAYRNRALGLVKTLTARGLGFAYASHVELVALKP
jgi:2-polyprenyl-3-methyl-5-hydroxy-6-metoxy-1,4-benzoquinol methylase